MAGIVNVPATGVGPDPIYPQPGAYDVLAFYSNYGAPATLSAPGGDCGLDDSCDPAGKLERSLCHKNSPDFRHHRPFGRSQFSFSDL